MPRWPASQRCGGGSNGRRIVGRARIDGSSRGHVQAVSFFAGTQGGSTAAAPLALTAANAEANTVVKVIRMRICPPCTGGLFYALKSPLDGTNMPIGTFR